MFLKHRRRFAIRRALFPAAMMVALPAQAQLCNGVNTPIGTDGRALGHLPYGDAPPAELTSAPAGSAAGACAMRAEVMADLQRLVTASGGRIAALSCHRSIAWQQSVFCREGATAADARALSVAPPGHSEHATGYALDFAYRPRQNGCPDTEACVAATPAFRWLVANAWRYGFEMSFPAGNRQNVKWEPWHWRWVGTSAAVPGAARARALFARARRDFKADPGVDTAIVVAGVAPPPVYLGAYPAPECRRGKCRMPKPQRR